MVEFLLFIAATIGMTNIFVESPLMSWPRKWLEKVLPKKLATLPSCYQCLGFWCGAFCGFALLTSSFIETFLCGCAGSFLSTMGVLIINYFEARTFVDISTADTMNEGSKSDED